MHIFYMRNCFTFATTKCKCL